VAAERSSRTRLKQVLAQRRLTVDEFRAGYQRVSGEVLSQRQAYRWVGGRLKGLPYPRAQAALERMFGEPAGRLLGRPYGAEEVIQPGATDEDRGAWQGQLVAISADRARDFLSTAEATNVGNEAIDQLADDLRRLTVAYPQQPLETLLTDIVDVQGRAFTLLEGRQPPAHSRDLYLLAGIASGLMAKASHDLGAPDDAMTQARAAYACADNAGHDGLRAWTRGMQALIAYWSGALERSARYAAQGAEAAGRTRGSAAVWLASGHARALAGLGRMSEAHDAIERAGVAWESVRPDELDEFGGLCTFTRPRQLYYAADALRWGGRDEAQHTERLATEALDAYRHAPPASRAFGDEAGTHCALAVARIERGEVGGAASALASVLDLPATQRIHGVVTSVEYVRRVLARAKIDSPAAAELDDALHTFGTERLALNR
jgi:hypothetical protein